MSKNIKIFKGEEKLDDLADMYEFYYFIKENFYSSTDYKWKIKKYKSFVKKNTLSYKFSHEILVNFHKDFIKFRKNHKLFSNFLNQIAKYNEKEQDFKITIIDGKLNKAICDFIEFLEKHCEESKEQILKITHNQLPTKLTWSTFRTYYYEYRFDCGNKKK